VRSLIAELHRRNVFRAGLAYLATSWLLTEVCGTLFPAFGVPDWAMRLLVILLLLGLPVVLVISWVYELTPEGFKRDLDVPNEQSIRHLTGRKLDFVVIGGLLVAVGLLLYDRNFPSHDLALENPRLHGSATASIAVLPFVNMSDDAANAYFSDGISEELLNALTHISGLRVVGRDSSFAYRGKREDLRSIGQQLNADNILAGSVRKAGERVRIAAQLINASTGFHLWSHTYDRRLDDIFQVQENIATAIIRALQVRLLPGQSLGHIRTNDVEAYDIYLQARGILRSATTVAENNRAIALFDQALKIDAGFVEAVAGKCRAYAAEYDDTLDVRLFELARNICRQASNMDESNIETRIALGQIFQLTGDSVAAIEQFHEVVRREPGNDVAWIGLADAQAANGDMDSASNSFERAIELRPDSAPNQSHFAVALFQAGHFQRALKHFLRAQSLNGGDASLYSNIGAVQFYLGHFKKAAESFEQSINRFPNATAYSNAGTNYYYAGNYATALKMFEKALQLSPMDYRLHGNAGDACRWVERKKPDSRKYYEQAVSLVDEHLQVNPNDADAVAYKGMYLQFLGQPAVARISIERAQEMAPKSFDVQLAAAITWNHLHELKRASAAVQAALDNGYPRVALEADPDLKNLTIHGNYPSGVGKVR